MSAPVGMRNYCATQAAKRTINAREFGGIAGFDAKACAGTDFA